MYKPRAALQVDAPKFGVRNPTDEDFVVWHPKVISAKWSRNNHLVADELTVSIPWKEGGIDPRALRNARGAFWLWDEEKGDMDLVNDLRFTGMCVKAERTLSESGWAVSLTFHDYTTMFIHNRPLATSGVPEWSDDLTDIWSRICDNTGWIDPASGKIVSSVKQLRDKLQFQSVDPQIFSLTLGQIVNPRFLEIAKPQPKSGASSWDFWQWCVGSLGLISYIDRDSCVVTTTAEHYKDSGSLQLVFGRNIHSYEENADTAISGNGILIKSFDPLTGRVMEAFYPKPGDPRLKTPRSAASKRSASGADITANEVSADFEEYTRYDLHTQQALEIAARAAYEERSRQELEGSVKTMEMELESQSGTPLSILELRAGDPIEIRAEPYNMDTLKSIGDEYMQIAYLVNECDYDPDVARIIVENLHQEALNKLIFHVKTLEVTLGPQQFEVEIKFHNLIVTEEPTFV